MQLLRALKLTKLVKLLRIFRSSRLIHRLQLAIGLSFASYSLAKFSAIVISVLHWVACLWRLVPDLEQAERNWITESDMANEKTKLALYVASFQF
jgi:hypothetical protein